MPWTRKFPRPFRLRDGRVIRTLKDAVDLMLGLPESHKARHVWMHAAEQLMEAAETHPRKALLDATAKFHRALDAEGLALSEKWRRPTSAEGHVINRVR